MLIVVTSHGYLCEAAWTQTFPMTRKDVPIVTLRNVLKVLEEREKVLTNQIDEVLVIEEDKVVYHFSPQDLDDEYEEVEVTELEVVEKVA